MILLFIVQKKIKFLAFKVARVVEADFDVFYVFDTCIDKFSVDQKRIYIISGKNNTKLLSIDMYNMDNSMTYLIPDSDNIIAFDGYLTTSTYIYHSQRHKLTIYDANDITNMKTYVIDGDEFEMIKITKTQFIMVVNTEDEKELYLVDLKNMTKLEQFDKNVRLNGIDYKNRSIFLSKLDDPEIIIYRY